MIPREFEVSAGPKTNGVVNWAGIRIALDTSRWCIDNHCNGNRSLSVMVHVACSSSHRYA
ncbi:hypothetical protein LCGC14_2836840, partial [marine sediment metagenome]